MLQREEENFKFRVKKCNIYCVINVTFVRGGPHHLVYIDFNDPQL